MYATFTALYDASVLYPGSLRSLLMYLATTELFQARWSDDIHDEWNRNVLKNNPSINPQYLAESRRLMDTHAEGALISNYQALIPSLNLPDPGDRHVLAAAIKGKANLIVTYNLKHFPAKELAPYEIEAQSPDTFIHHLLDLAPTTVINIIRRQRQQLKKPPLSPSEFLEKLEKLIPNTVTVLQNHISQL